MDENKLILLIADDKVYAIGQAIDTLEEYRQSGQMSKRDGVTVYRPNGHYVQRDDTAMRGHMTRREREIYEMGLRDSMTPRERELYEMGKRDAYGQNGAENMRNKEGGDNW